MARYIDAEQLIRDLIDNRSFYPAIVKRAIENAPTEDVVPRSEVEELIEERDRYKKYYYRHEYDSWEAEIKQELVDEILDTCKYLYTIEEIREYFAELKKKYIGE